MRYALVDLEGATRDYFSTRGATVDALRKLDEEAPGTAAEVYVVTYDDAGNKHGEPERGDEMIATPDLIAVWVDWTTDDPEPSSERPTDRAVAGAGR